MSEIEQKGTTDPEAVTGYGYILEWLDARLSLKNWNSRLRLRRGNRDIDEDLDGYGLAG